MAAWLSLAAALPGCGPPTVPPASAAQRAQVRVVLYAARWCPACAHARSWLRRRGIPFEERDVEQSRAASARLVTLNPARTVPTIVVEGRVVVGFVEEELRRAVDSAAHRY
jgi:glutaredoxin